MLEMNTINYYQLLGLKPELEVDQIRQELLDKFTQTKARAGLATGEKLEQINKYLKWIKEATKILTDPDAKANYDAQLSSFSLTEIKEKINLKNTVYTVEEIWHLIEQGNYSDAVEKAKILASENSNDDNIWEIYGRASYLSDDTQTAIYAGERAIECNPQRASLYADLAEYYADIQQWDKAITKLNQTIELEPNNLGCKLALSQIYIQSEKWGDAEAILTGVLSQDLSNETARQFMAIVIGSKAEARLPEIDELLKQNKKREARKILKEVHQQFEEAQKLAQNDPELKDLLNSESISVRRELGVNFYLRVLGLIIDFAIVSPAILLMTVQNGNNAIAVTLGFLLMIAVWGYSWIWLAYKNSGQDFTKRLLGLQIVSDANTQATLNQFIGRAITKPISVGLGALFPFLVIIVSGVMAMDDPAKGEAAGFIGAAIGIGIGMVFAFYKLLFDLFFVTSKEYLPNFFGWLLFLHEHISKTSVIHSTKDDFMNFGEYKWIYQDLKNRFGLSHVQSTSIIVVGIALIIIPVFIFVGSNSVLQQSPPPQPSEVSPSPPTTSMEPNSIPVQPSPSLTLNLSYQPTCGSPYQPDLQWYAVVGDPNSLNAVKTQYCGDSYIRADGNVQVASFTSEQEAQQFANALQQATGYQFWVRVSIRK